MRVLEALSIPSVSQALRYKIPKECLTPPDNLTTRYPTPLLKHFPPQDKYIVLGVITEYLLRHQATSITPTLLRDQTKQLFNIDVPEKSIPNDYLDKIKNTRTQLEQLATQPLLYDITLSSKNIEGHPDIHSGVDVFEIKTSGRVKQSWKEFMLQLFAYAALDPNVTRVHLVLPLDCYIWSYDLTNWDKKKRNAYKTILEEATPPPKQDTTMAQLLISTYSIGTHFQKQKTLPATIRSIISSGITGPVQIFLGGPTTLRLKTLPDEELAQTRSLVEQHNIALYIHAPYTINLADKVAETFLPCLTKQLEIGSAIGARGVVVHVGKHCNRYPCTEVARNYMKIAIHEATKSVTHCPLLLETPAGQGTELLTKMEDFIDFALEMSYELPVGVFGICVDTCHVYATGTCPLTYLNYTFDKAKTLLQLIHFNDSKGDCGSCLDRHEIICCGKINPLILTECAQLAASHSVPMVME